MTLISTATVAYLSCCFKCWRCPLQRRGGNFWLYGTGWYWKMHWDGPKRWENDDVLLCCLRIPGCLYIQNLWNSHKAIFFYFYLGLFLIPAAEYKAFSGLAQKLFFVYVCWRRNEVWAPRAPWHSSSTDLNVDFLNTHLLTMDTLATSLPLFVYRAGGLYRWNFWLGAACWGANLILAHGRELSKAARLQQISLERK